MKKVLSVLLTLFMLISIIPLGAVTASAETVSGQCGQSVNWSLDLDTSSLTISGEGDMDDWSYESDTYAPWMLYKDNITSVVISDGVTNIGNEAFRDLSQLSTVTIADSVKTIGDYAFYGQNNIYQLSLPQNLESIGSYAFCDTYLQNILIPQTVTSIGVSVFYEDSDFTVFGYTNTAAQSYAQNNHITFVDMNICETITFDQEKTVNKNVNGGEALFAFTPTETADYCFYSYNSVHEGLSNKGYIYDSQMNNITIGHGYDTSRHFKIDCYMEKGKTYYLRATTNNDTEDYEEFSVKVVHPVDADGIEITYDGEREVYVGDELFIYFKFTPHIAIRESVEWKTSNPEVATITEEGHVEFLTAGDVTFTVESESGKADSIEFTVVNRPPATSISISGYTKTSVLVGSQQYLYCNFLPFEALDPITWKSSDQSIATVDTEEGVTVNFLSQGEVTITAETPTGITDSVTFNVIDLTYSPNILLDEEKIINNAVNNGCATFAFTPNETANYTFYSYNTDGIDTYASIYDSSTTEILSDDDSGSKLNFIMHAELTEGETYYLMTSTYSTSPGEYSIIIKKAVSAESVEITNVENTEVYVGNYDWISYNINPDYALSEEVTWESSDPDVATIDTSDGVCVNFHTAGTVTITVETNDTSRVDSVTYTVLERPPVEEIFIYSSGSYTEFVGDSTWLYYGFTPENSEEPVEWSSSNQNIATIDSDGYVSFLAPGTVTFTIESESGKTDSVTFTVKARPKATGMVIISQNTYSSKDATVFVGDCDRLECLTKPYDSFEEATFISSNNSIATVYEYGDIEFLSPGKVTITATSTSGLKDTITFNVINRPTATDITISNYERKHYFIGEVTRLDFDLAPYGAIDSAIFTSSNPAVAEIYEDPDEGEVYVEFLSKGQATITAQVIDGPSDTVTFNVFDETDAVTIDINQEKTVNYADNEGFALYAFTPENSGKYTFYSYNTSENIYPYTTIYDSALNSIDCQDTGSMNTFIISCDLTGGETYYLNTKCYSETNNGQYSLKIVDTPNPTAVMIVNDGSMDAYVGEYKYLYYEFLPQLAPYESGSWQTSNPDVAVVSEWGDVEFIAEGNVTITFTTDSGLTDSIDYIVTPLPPTSGSCGVNAQWSVNTETGVLSITGSGNITERSTPWWVYRYDITSVVISKNITNVSDSCFSFFPNISSVTISDTVKSIGEYAFNENYSLSQITIPSGVESIGHRAFENCKYLESITIPASVKNIGENAFLYCHFLTIYGYANTYAHTYAKANDIPFVCLHTYNNACDTTCNNCNAVRTVAGHKGGTATCTVKAKCTTCSAYYGSLKAHNPISANKVATTSADGVIGKTVCSVCKNPVNNGTVIKKVTSFKLSTDEYTYNGKSKKPSVTVKDSSGKKLVKDVDYTVKYASGRKKVGKYKVTVTLKGKYSGTKNLYFEINPKGTKISKLTAAKKSLKVSIKKQSSQTTGYQVQYSTSKKFKSKTTKTIKSYKTTSYTIKKLKAKKTYYVRVRTYKTVNGKKFYSGWSTYKYKKTK